MTDRGTVKNGMVELEDGVDLPDGMAVEVHPADPEVACDDDHPLQSVVQLARRTGLPSDFATQHDHYIHGTPKR